jgi:hypothetical protein
MMSSLRNVVKTVHPNTSLNCIPLEFGVQLKEDRKYFDWLATKLGLKSHNDWYRVTYEVVSKKGGLGILSRYGHSLYKALSSVYPEKEFHPWLFVNVPRNFWKDKNHQRECLDWVGKQLGITHLDEWNKITRTAARQRGAGGLLSYHGNSLPKMLRAVYSEHKWNRRDKMSAAHFHWWYVLKSHLQGEVVLLNYKHPMMFHAASHRRMELDIYVPSLQLAFECQGEQHYKKVYSSPLESQLKRDNEKKNLCAQLGINLTEIPYWCTSQELQLPTNPQLLPTNIPTNIQSFPNKSILTICVCE